MARLAAVSVPAAESVLGHSDSVSKFAHCYRQLERFIDGVGSGWDGDHLHCVVVFGAVHYDAVGARSIEDFCELASCNGDRPLYGFEFFFFVCAKRHLSSWLQIGICAEISLASRCNRQFAEVVTNFVLVAEGSFNVRLFDSSDYRLREFRADYDFVLFDVLENDNWDLMRQPLVGSPQGRTGVGEWLSSRMSWLTVVRLWGDACLTTMARGFW